ncbi:E3 ubiquitin-protein ligase rnf146-like [Rhynchophorus ferrugineus]|uniref:E3 ubiquitin-protein ligase rnf146-like n=1 Tax=Rhynchophorus ferrugineus TaxID=354439 RepID=UPI003FCC3125
MAEALASVEKDADKTNGLECAVCLQPCIHPAQLPCGHIFCFLCVKGFANQSKRCAMCRKEIPVDFIEQPQLVEQIQNTDASEGYDGIYQWFYEGRNGWWQYDERTSRELENSYKKGEKSVELLIAGFLYVIDFENMLQLRRNDPSRRRRIKRDFSTIPKKGIAGIRTEPPLSSSIETREIPEIRPVSPTDGNVDNSRTIPVTPSNTPQTPASGRESPNQEQDLQATVERISNLRLDDNRNDPPNESTTQDEDDTTNTQQFTNVCWRGHHSHHRHTNDD